MRIEEKSRELMLNKHLSQLNLRNNMLTRSLGRVGDNVTKIQGKIVELFR